jgi:hypothetical protein
MTRKPNKNSKSAQIIVRAGSSQEQELRAFKELCADKGLEMRKLVFDRCILPFLSEQKWQKPQDRKQRKMTAYAGGN